MKLAEEIYHQLAEGLGDGTAVSLAIIKDGELEVSAAAGTRDGDPAHPVTTGDLFNIGSCSKVYVTAAVMKLAEWGKITLDTPVYQILPRFRMRDPRYRDITVRHLLNHSSGLPGTNYYLWFASEFIDKDLMIDKFYEYLSRSLLKADPGAYSVYCNDGFNLAQLVVEEVTGQPFTLWLCENILRPLGIRSTGSCELNPDHRAYVVQKGKTAENILAIGCGGLATDMEDLARFCWSFIETRDVITEDIALQMGTPQETSQGNPGGGSRFGLGWDSVCYTGKGFSFGSNAWMKAGGTMQFGTYMIVSREHRLALAISMTGDIKTAQNPGKYAAQVLGAEFLLPEAKEKQKLPEEIVRTYTGRYFTAHGYYDVSFENDCLTLLPEDDPSVPFIKDAYWTGSAFWTENAEYSFVTGSAGNKYLCVYDTGGCTVFAEMPAQKYEISEGWLAREGKFYLPVDMHEADLFLSVFGGVIQIRNNRDSGLVGFLRRGSLTSYYDLTAVSDGDDATGYYLTRARDISTPFVWRENGAEYMRFLGYKLVEEDMAESLTAGGHEIPAGTCQPYRIRAGETYKLSYEGVRIVYFSKDMHTILDSLMKEKPETVSEGWIIVLSRNGGLLRVYPEA